MVDTRQGLMQQEIGKSTGTGNGCLAATTAIPAMA
jgi:hypothetical protein